MLKSDWFGFELLSGMELWSGMDEWSRMEEWFGMEVTVGLNCGYGVIDEGNEDDKQGFRLLGF